MSPAATSTLTHAGIVSLLELRKESGPLPKWNEKPKYGELVLEAALLHEGATVAGLTLCLTCHKERPLEGVAVQLLVETTQKPKPMARVDWNGKVHGNTHRLAGHMRHLSAGRTHFHDPRLHDPERDPMQYLNDNLPVATPIQADADHWMTILQISGNLLNIDGLTKCPEPRWEPRLS